ncbi:hypothetical protein RI129_001356 [Pyrocoelia pectoralis]|uniref:Retrotransposon gag domain-containing protein n=1 Tax=Pyrocoelia pectoralis TaxID=417401 RepID=A0AAN7ZST2_9COLE
MADPSTTVDASLAEDAATAVPQPISELESLRLLVQQQAAALDTFVKNQQSVNRGLLDSLEQLSRTHVTPEPVVSAAETVRSQQRVSESSAEQPTLTPIASSTPLPPVVSSGSLNISEWKEVALALTRRPFVGSVAEKPLFSPDRHHPVTFLERFERYFRLGRFDVGEKLEVVRSCLIGSTLDWVGVRASSWHDFDDFHRDFLGYFWSADLQHAERTRLTNMRYVSEGVLSMPQFFLRQVTLFRTFTPVVPEETIVADVMRQFPSSIQSLWAVSPARDFDGALKFLDRQYSLGGQRRRTLSEPTSATVSRRPRLDLTPEREDSAPGTSGNARGSR